MNIIIYFRNLTVKLHILYALNTHIKFCEKLDIIYYIICKSIFYA